MKLKKMLFIQMSFIILSVFFTGCSVSSSEDIEIIYKPVKTEILREEKRPVFISRVGNVIPESKVNYSFKSSGKVKELFVKSGDSVSKGDILASIDTSDLELQLKALDSKMSIAMENIEKASDNHEYNKNEYKNMKKIYDAGGISKDTLDKLKLNMDISDLSLQQAVETLNADKAKYDLTKKLIDESLLVSDIDGIVLNTYFESGEIIATSQPIVTVRSLSSVALVGISNDDKALINENTEIEVEYNDELLRGELISIDDMPDSTTRTYATKIRILNKKMGVGEIVDIKFNVGEENGIWVSIDAIMSDGEKFVYIVNNERAFKRIITIDEVFEYEVKANGLNNGEFLVVDGMKNLTDGVNVQIVE